jgi:hypothetical protein
MCAAPQAFDADSDNVQNGGGFTQFLQQSPKRPDSPEVGYIDAHAVLASGFSVPPVLLAMLGLPE